MRFQQPLALEVRDQRLREVVEPGGEALLPRVAPRSPPAVELALRWEEEAGGTSGTTVRGRDGARAFARDAQQMRRCLVAGRARPAAEGVPSIFASARSMSSLSISAMSRLKFSLTTMRSTATDSASGGSV